MADPVGASCRFASALSVETDIRRAVTEVCQSAMGGLQGTPDLAVLLVSSDRGPACDEIAGEVCRRLGTNRLIGCTAESVLGIGREIEGAPALSLWLAQLPGAELQAIHLAYETTPEGGVFVGWPDALLGSWPEHAAMLLLGDPFSFPADLMLQRMNEDHPGVPVIGGMASGSNQPGRNRLLLGPDVHSTGAVAVVLGGGVRVQTVVSQGCRPIGTHFVITKAERNVIYELGGQPAAARLRDVLVQLPMREQQMVRNGLHLGRVVSEYQERFEPGDFLVRNVMGVDPENGAVVVADYMRVGQTVKFHIRDEQTADADLRQLLAGARDQVPTCGGALMFTCNGRGTRLFSEPDHDARAVQQALGEIPLAGFFAAGELGPVAGKNFVHGFTASLALFHQV
jgi:small ligand-binding sensory domain FIST